MPSSRQTSGTSKPASTGLRASMIWLFVNLERFMQNASNWGNSTSDYFGARGGITASISLF